MLGNEALRNEAQQMIVIAKAYYGMHWGPVTKGYYRSVLIKPTIC